MERWAIAIVGGELDATSASRWSEEWLAEHAELDDVPVRQLLWTAHLVVKRRAIRDALTKPSTGSGPRSRLHSTRRIPPRRSERPVIVRPFVLPDGDLLVTNYLPRTVQIVVTARSLRFVLDDQEAYEFVLTGSKGSSAVPGLVWTWQPRESALAG